MNKRIELIKFCNFPIVLSIIYLISISVGSYFQFVLDYEPCSICVDIRYYFTFLFLISVLMMIIGKYRSVFFTCLIISLILCLSGVYSSFIGYQIETGAIISQCSLDSLFSTYIPLHKIVPSFFTATGLCGKSPTMVFDITMMVGSLVTFTLLSLLNLYVSIQYYIKRIHH